MLRNVAEKNISVGHKQMGRTLTLAISNTLCYNSMRISLTKQTDVLNMS
jgi:hypothetical protein